MFTVNKCISVKMANMSFFCACLVVLLHCTPAVKTLGSLDWWICHMLLREGVCNIAVPFFFFASGYFFMVHADGDSWWIKSIKKRVKSLLVPFFIWMFIYQIFWGFLRVGKGRPFSLLNGLSYSEWVLSIAGLHPFSEISIFWFIRSLFFIVIVSPILVYCVRGKWVKCVVLVILILMHLSAQYYFGNDGGWRVYSLFDRYISIRGICWFYIGMLLNTAKMFNKFEKQGGLFCVCVGLLLMIIKNLLCLNGAYGYEWVIEALSVPCFVFGLLPFVPDKPFPRILITNSFSVFLLHNIFLSISAWALASFGLYAVEEMPFLIMTIRFLFAVVFSIYISTILHRCAPRFSQLLFGGR